MEIDRVASITIGRNVASGTAQQAGLPRTRTDCCTRPGKVDGIGGRRVNWTRRKKTATGWKRCPRPQDRLYFQKARI